MISSKNFVTVTKILLDFISNGGVFVMDDLVAIIGHRVKDLTKTRAGVVSFLGIASIYEDMLFYTPRLAVCAYGPVSENLGAFLLYDCKTRSDIQAHDVVAALLKIKKFYELNELPS